MYENLRVSYFDNFFCYSQGSWIFGWLDGGVVAEIIQKISSKLLRMKVDICRDILNFIISHWLFEL